MPRGFKSIGLMHARTGFYDRITIAGVSDVDPTPQKNKIALSPREPDFTVAGLSGVYPTPKEQACVRHARTGFYSRCF